MGSRSFGRLRRIKRSSCQNEMFTFEQLTSQNGARRLKNSIWECLRHKETRPENGELFENGGTHYLCVHFTT